MDYFTQSEIDLFNNMAGKQRNKPNDEKQYNDLKKLYEKIGYWTQLVKERLFTDGKIGIQKKPTSQWGKYEYYHWAKLYPQKNSNPTLAYTLSLEEYSFIVKIDTVGLTNDKPIRIEYFEYRGDYSNSAIVKTKSSDDVLNMNWEALVEWSIQELQGLKPHFDKLETLLFPKTTPSVITPNSSTISMKPRNIILFGPPGTGKTYHTIDLAVSLADEQPVDSEKHEANKVRFNELRKAGEIEFVTFHQNYSYEDFMVGLRPNTEGGNLAFREHKGIFYNLCEAARDNYLGSLKEGFVKEPNFDEVLEKFLESLSEEGEAEIKMKANGYYFHVTELTGDGKRLKFRKKDGSTIHDLLIKNIKGIYDGSTMYNTEGLGVYYYPLNDRLKAIAQDMKTVVKTDLKQYVLVIDEINRANISRVFGELITLLEDDKRIGMKHELRITLPNGETDFGIPPNLHIVGTMNTADKSIALVDIALRRRFEFIGKYPTYEANDEVFYTSEKADLLKAINKKVFEAKKTADFLIGHAYFMKNEPIEMIIKNKVIPLLMEYFNNRDSEVVKIFEQTQWKVSYDIDQYDWKIEPRTQQA